MWRKVLISYECTATSSSISLCKLLAKILCESRLVCVRSDFVYPGMENLRLGESLVSLMAAMSILLTRKNRSNSAFLVDTEFALQVTMRKLWIICGRRNSQQLYQSRSPVW